MRQPFPITHCHESNFVLKKKKYFFRGEGEMAKEREREDIESKGGEIIEEVSDKRETK
jgi:hypothetical protein